MRMPHPCPSQSAPTTSVNSARCNRNPPFTFFTSVNGKNLKDKVAFAPIDPYPSAPSLAALKRHPDFFLFLDLPNFRFTQ
jgi:hypothetical protein